MRITLELDKEIQDALQLHLDTEHKIQDYIRSALRYFNTMRQFEIQGNKCGYGDKNRFASYNTIVSPETYLQELD